MLSSAALLSAFQPGAYVSFLTEGPDHGAESMRIVLSKVSVSDGRRPRFRIDGLLLEPFHHLEKQAPIVLRGSRPDHLVARQVPRYEFRITDGGFLIEAPIEIRTLDPIQRAMLMWFESHEDYLRQQAAMAERCALADTSESERYDRMFA